VAPELNCSVQWKTGVSNHVLEKARKVTTLDWEGQLMFVDTSHLFIL
jgi:hypothetical protein